MAQRRAVKRDGEVGRKVCDDIPLTRRLTKGLAHLLGRGDDEGVGAGGGEEAALRGYGEEARGRGGYVIGGPRREYLELLGAFGALAQCTECYVL